MEAGVEAGISIGFKSWGDFFMTLFFLSICTTGVILNVTLLYGILKEKLYHSSSNLYIMNLAVADFGIAVGILFFPTLDYALTVWPFGSVTCKVFEVIRDTTTPVSTLTLAALSIQRYQAISAIGVWKGKTPKTFRVKSCLSSRTGIAILLLWLAALSSQIPITVLGRWPDLPIEKRGDHRICMLDRYEYVDPKILVVIRCTITYIVPLLIIAFSYGAISWKLCSMSQSLEKYRQCPAMDRSRKKAMNRAKLIMVLVSVFFLCSFPCHFFLWVFYFASDDVITFRHFWDKWRVIGFYLFYIYPIMNPLFLYATSEHYKSLYDKYLFSCRGSTAVVVDDEADDNEESQMQEMSSSSYHTARIDDPEWSKEKRLQTFT